MMRAPCWFPRVINVLTIVSAGAVWLYTCNDTLFYFAGSTVREVIVALFTICLFAQLARAVMPSLLKVRRSVKRLVPAVLCVLLLAVMLNLEAEQFFKREVERYRADRISYSGESDAAIMRAFTDRYFYYPPESFLEEARRRIPEGDAVLYIGDIRPDPVNYALYPRPVYAVGELQRATLASAIYAWTRDDDPAFPRGFAPWLQDSDVDAEGITEETRRLISERDVRWVIIVDSLDESRNRIVRIVEGE